VIRGARLPAREVSLAACLGIASCGERPPAEERSADAEPMDVAALMERGEQVYATNCLACHQGGGDGVPGMQPSLVGSPIAIGDPDFLIEHTLRGVGVPGGLESSPDWRVSMPAFHRLSDREIAGVLTYIRQSWGNEAEPIRPPRVADVRADLRDRGLLEERAGG